MTSSRCLIQNLEIVIHLTISGNAPTKTKMGFQIIKGNQQKLIRWLTCGLGIYSRNRYLFCDNVVQVKARDCRHFREATGGESGYGTDRYSE